MKLIDLEKFTKKERLEIYEYALTVVMPKHPGFGLCFYLSDAIENIWKEPIIAGMNIDPYIYMEVFPEINKYKPKEEEIVAYWFPKTDIERRKKILKEAVKELRDALSENSK